MKPTAYNDLGKKYLVENCQKVSIIDVVSQLRSQMNKSMIEADVVINNTKIRLVSSSLYHGGERLWLECPLCQLPVGIVFQHPVQNELVGCRKCLQLEYRSRRYKGMVEETF